MTQILALTVPERMERMNKNIGAKMRRFWNWSNDGGERVLHLYGTIAEESWAEDDVTPEMFREELMSDSGPITIWLSSPGGDCIAASQIYAMLMDYPFDVTIKIDGIAASAASVIAMAGTTVLMAPTALMMCHNPATIAMGDHNDMAKAIDLLETVKESIINAYEIKTGLDRKTISAMMEEETWMDAHRLWNWALPMGSCLWRKYTALRIHPACYSLSGRLIPRW